MPFLTPPTVRRAAAGRRHRRRVVGVVACLAAVAGLAGPAAAAPAKVDRAPGVGTADRAVVVPSAPRSLVVTPGHGAIDLTWDAPTTGTSAITGYLVTVTITDPSDYVGRVRHLAFPPSARSARVDTLMDFIYLQATVRATTATGVGPIASAAPVQPAPTMRVLRESTGEDDRLLDAVFSRYDWVREGLVVVLSDRIASIDLDTGVLTTLVGGNPPGAPTVDGTAALAVEARPTQAAVGRSGVVTWMDAGTRSIRQSVGGVVETLVAEDDLPDGEVLAVDDLSSMDFPRTPGRGEVPYWVDTARHVVRRATASGGTEVVLGRDGVPGFAGDGGDGSDSLLDSPTTIGAVNDVVMVGDSGNHRIRAIELDGTYSSEWDALTTLIGNGGDTPPGVETHPLAETELPGPVTFDTIGDPTVYESGGRLWAANGPFALHLGGRPGAPPPGPDALSTEVDYRQSGTVLASGFGDGALVLVADPEAGVTSRLWIFGRRTYGSHYDGLQPAAVATPPTVTPTGGSVRLSWQPSADDGWLPVKTYRIESDTGGVGRDVVGPDGGAAPRQTELDVPDDRPRRYRVVAVTAKGKSEPSPWSEPVSTAHAPFASWSAFVERQYLDVVDRLPSASERSSWVNQLTAGTKQGFDLVDELRRSAENTANVDPAVRLYAAFLGRIPDRAGLEFWLDRRRSGAWTLNRMADHFAGSSEFRSRYGALSNRAFVSRIYTDVLGRSADPAGVAFWTAQLDQRRRSRGAVMVGFSDSGEYRRKQHEFVDAVVAHVFLLGRSPTTTEVDEWSTAQRELQSQKLLLMTLLDSAEYQARFADG